MANPNPTHKWTAEEAREAGKRSAERKAYLKANPPPEPEPVAILEPVSSQPTLSDYAQELLCARDELLAEMRTTPLAKDKASIAQALKNVMESYHMETGKPKPGTIKPVSARPRQSPAHESPDAPDGQ